LLVEVRLAVDPVGVPLERERAAAKMGDDHVPDLGVVLGEVALRHSVAREEDAVGMRQPDGAASNLQAGWVRIGSDE
jgi:hypothetical protein